MLRHQPRSLPLACRPRRLLLLIAAPAAALALLPLAPAAAQDLSAVDLSGAWRIVANGTFDDPSVPPKFKTTHVLYVTQDGSSLAGVALLKLGPCGLLEVPFTGAKSGASFFLDEALPVMDFKGCAQTGTLTLNVDAGLADGANALVTGAGSFAGNGGEQSGLAFTAKLKRISGLQTPDDPDGPGPAVPLDQMGPGAPAGIGVHDLAVTRIKTVKSVPLKAKDDGTQRYVFVTIQNRGQHTETIDDVATLASVVRLNVDKVGGELGEVFIELRAPAPVQFPVVLKPRKSFTAHFLVTFLQTLPTPVPTPQPGVFAWTASVHHEALEGSLPDDHPEDDVAPRSIAAPPFTFDAYPDGKVKERGVGSKKADGTFGDPVLTTFFISG